MRVDDMDDKRTTDLTPLDPGHRDPSYWDRFQARAMAAALPLLEERARRRMPRIGSLLVSWGRGVAPAAALAAGLAALVLLSDMPAEVEPQPMPLLAVEEILGLGLHRSALPASYTAEFPLGLEAFLRALEDAPGEGAL
jgi:hypothetical protein